MTAYLQEARETVHNLWGCQARGALWCVRMHTAQIPLQAPLWRNYHCVIYFEGLTEMHCQCQCNQGGVLLPHTPPRPLVCPQTSPVFRRGHLWLARGNNYSKQGNISLWKQTAPTSSSPVAGRKWSFVGSVTQALLTKSVKKGHHRDTSSCVLFFSSMTNNQSVTTTSRYVYLVLIS